MEVGNEHQPAAKLPKDSAFGQRGGVFELTRLLGIHGQENGRPAVAIGRAYQRLPSARSARLKMLK
jgi:hypothetical protein